MKVRAVVHGAVSLVNAIATRRGATLGVDLKVSVTAESVPGKGILLESTTGNFSSRLINSTIKKAVPKKKLDSNRISIHLDSEIPAGYGLKSSSAISSAVALACSQMFRPSMSDRQILMAGVNASIESKVSITGAYDDACSCYYGGFNVTDNARKARVHSEDGPTGMEAVIFIPKKRRRGNLKNLKMFSAVFDRAWKLAQRSRYWEAMVMNGLATSVALDSDLDIITCLLESGAYGASVSGNGPAIAAIIKRADRAKIKRVFDGLEGYTMTSKINNKKARVYEV